MSTQLKEEVIALANSLHSTGLPEGFGAAKLRPESPEHRRERFGIAAYILQELTPSIIVRDADATGLDAFRFTSTPDAEVTDVPTLALWTNEQFVEVAKIRYDSDLTFKAAIDRLDQISTTAALKKKYNPGIPALENTVMGLGSTNYAVDLDISLRRGLWAGSYYDMELPESGGQMQEYARRTLSNLMQMAWQPLVVQDFFDVLDELSLFGVREPQAKTKQERNHLFKDVVGLVNDIFRMTHADHVVDEQVTTVPGSVPKAFYKIGTDDKVILTVEPMTEKIAKMQKEEKKAQTIGCAAGLIKCAGLGTNPLQAGLRATLREMRELGYFEADPYSLVGLPDYRMTGVEFRGQTIGLNIAFMDNIAKLQQLGILPDSGPRTARKR